MIVEKAYTFDDVLLKPRHSEIKSRSQIDISVDLGKGIKLYGPYISANMKTVTGPELAQNMGKYGMGILHRFDTLEGQINNYKRAVRWDEYHEAVTPVGFDKNPFRNHVGISVGISNEDENDKLIEDTGTKIVCIDVAHGDHGRVIKETERLSRKFPEVLLIVGNVATGEGAKRLARAGADVIKVGVGPGSLCTTRVETGNGVPQLSALDDVYDTLEVFNDRPKIIADGGIKKAGDVVKALCFSDAVMLGSILAGTSESPGEVIKGPSGKKYKTYAGSSTHKTNHIEGVSGLTPYKGSMHDILQSMSEGLRSGLSYQGCADLTELKEDPEFVEISPSGLKESHPHANIVKG